MKNSFFDNGVKIDVSNLPAIKKVLHECRSGACDHYSHFIGIDGKEYYEEWNGNKHVAEVKPK